MHTNIKSNYMKLTPKFMCYLFTLHLTIIEELTSITSVGVFISIWSINTMLIKSIHFGKSLKSRITVLFLLDAHTLMERNFSLNKWGECLFPSLPIPSPCLLYQAMTLVQLLVKSASIYSWGGRICNKKRRLWKTVFPVRKLPHHS